MDDLFDDFMPLSMTDLKQPITNSSTSPEASVSRLSRSYFKRRKRKNGYETKIMSDDDLCSSSVISISDSEMSSHHQTSTDILQFCPTCQAPFDIMNVKPYVHAQQCNVVWKDLEECQKGELCFEKNIFHYRDYAHSFLAQIRASSGHLLQKTPCVTPEKVIKNKCKTEQFKSPYPLIRNRNALTSSSSDRTGSSPLSNNKEIQRTTSGAINGKLSTERRILFSDAESTHSPRKDTSVNDQLPTNNNKFSGLCNAHHPLRGTASNIKVGQNCCENTKCNVKESSCTTANLKSFTESKKKDDEKIIECSTCDDKEDIITNKRITKHCKEGLMHVSGTCETEEFKSNMKTTLVNNCKTGKSSLQEHRCEKNCDCECSQNLKLDTIVEYTNNLDKNGNEEKLNVKTCVLPCNRMEKAQVESQRLNEVRASMSIVLSPSRENSVPKLETPIKVDASCSEVGWETVEIAAMPETEVGDVTVSLCKCTKTMQVNCSLSESQSTTNISNKTVIKDEVLESKFFKNVKELQLFPGKCDQKDPSQLPNHQMSITSYFKSSHHPLSSPKRATTANKHSFVAAQEANCSTSNDLSLVTKEDLTNTSIAPKQNKELVVAHWKQILTGMTQRGQSSMAVMSDDSLTNTSDGLTSTRNSDSSQYSGKKSCPSYKRIPDTTFVVDAFQYGIISRVSHYFLSHFHSDHYGGLRKSFSKPIICSKITAALVKMKLRVDERYLHVLELDMPKKICGVLVTALDANHCPGSVMFLFQLPDGRNFLHVGDFRADPKMESYPCFWNVTIDKLYLDTTYCEPRYDFPMQSDTIEKVVELAVEHHSRAPATLFVCGTYTIGKEKVFLGIVEALNCKMWAHSEKRKVLECIDNPIINERLTNRQWEAQVHVCRLSDLNYTFLQRYLKQHQGAFTHIVAFIPTGWEIMKGKNSDINISSYGNVTIYGVPYSEHSSFTELKRFVQFLKPVEVIPTVNVGHVKKRAAMNKYFQQWLSESPIKSLKRKSEAVQHVQQKIARYLNVSRMRKRVD